MLANAAWDPLAFFPFGITGIDKGLPPIIGLLSKSGYVRFSKILKNFFAEVGYVKGSIL